MNSFGESIKITVFGDTGASSSGVVVDGLPVGEEIDEALIKDFMAARAPASSELGSRNEDNPEFVVVSGLTDGRINESPFCAVIRSNVSDVSATKNLPRPGYADFAVANGRPDGGEIRFGGTYDSRQSAPVLIAGAICLQLLERRGVKVNAELVSVGGATGDGFSYEMKKEILDARASGDSVGGVVECTATGVPPGCGGYFTGGIDSKIAALLFANPLVCGVEFGEGFKLAAMRGSQANDPIRLSGGRLSTETNNAGGVNFGVANGMPLVLRCALRPGPSIGREQRTVDLGEMQETTIRLRGRHEPSSAPGAVPLVESVVAFCILDSLLANKAYFRFQRNPGDIGAQEEPGSETI